MRLEFVIILSVFLAKASWATDGTNPQFDTSQSSDVQVYVGITAEYRKLKLALKHAPGETERVIEVNADHFPAESILKLMEKNAPDGHNTRLGIEFSKLPSPNPDSYYLELGIPIPESKLDNRKLTAISIIKSEHDSLATTSNQFLTEWGWSSYDHKMKIIDEIKAKIDDPNMSIEDLQKLSKDNPNLLKTLTKREKTFVKKYTPPDMYKLTVAQSVRSAIFSGDYEKLFGFLIEDYQVKCAGNFDLYKEGIRKALDMAVEKKYLSSDEKNRILAYSNFDLENDHGVRANLPEELMSIRMGIMDKLIWKNDLDSNNYDENNNEVVQISCNAPGNRRRRSSQNPCVFHLEDNDDKKINLDDIDEFEKRVKKIDSQALIEYLKDKSPAERNKIFKIIDAAGPEKIHGTFDEHVNNLLKKYRSDVHNANVREIEKIVKSDEIIKILVDDVGKDLSKKSIFEKTLVSPSEYQKSVSKNPSNAEKFANSASKQFGRLGKAVLAKDLMSGLLRGDSKSLAIMTGLVVGDKMLEVTGQFVGKKLAIAGANKMSRAAALTTLGVSKTGTQKAGKFLNTASKVVGPFAGSATSGYSIYTLVTSINDFKSGNTDAIADIVGDSISIANSVVSTSVQTLRAFSAITGPAGPIIIAVSVAVDILAGISIGIFKAIRVVESIDKLIQLDDDEKFKEGVRAFFGKQISPYLRKLMADKSANIELVHNMLEFLQNNKQYRRIVSSTSSLHIRNCRKYLSPNCFSWLRIDCENEICDEDYKVDMDSYVNFSKKQLIYLERSQPGQPSNAGNVFCTKGSLGYIENYSEKYTTYGYYCKNAIGVEIHHNKNNQTLYNLGDGLDVAHGFPDSGNVFNVNNGIKNFYGGEKDDVFYIQAQSSLIGVLDGRGGLNSLILGNTPRGNLTVNLLSNSLKGPSITVQLDKIQKVIGRKAIPDTILSSCDTVYIDGLGGSDTITIGNLNCTQGQDMIVKLYNNDYLENLSNLGKFLYIVDKTTYSDIILNLSHTVTHSIFYEKQMRDLKYIMFHSNDTLNIDGSKINIKLDTINTNDKHDNWPRIFTMTPSAQIESEIKWAGKNELQIVHYLNKDSGSTSGFFGETNFFTINDIFILNDANYRGGTIIGSNSGKNILSISQNFTNLMFLIDIYHGHYTTGGLSNKINLNLKNIQIFQGRLGKPDSITPGCTPMFIDGQGGNDIHYDIIYLRENNCTERPQITINVGNYSIVKGYSTGYYTYLISYDNHFHMMNLALNSQTIHKIIFSFPLEKIVNFAITQENEIKFTLKSGVMFNYTYDSEIEENQKEKQNDKDFEGFSNSKKERVEDQGLIQFHTTRMLGDQIEFTFQINHKKEINLIYHLVSELNSELSEVKGILLCSTYQCIFDCKSGNWTVFSKENDIFLIESDDFNGFLRGSNSSLAIEPGFAPNDHVIIDQKQNKIYSSNNSIRNMIHFEGMSEIFGRPDNSDYILTSCSSQLIDGRGGKNSQNPDEIEIFWDKNCQNSQIMEIIIGPYTNVINFAKFGDFRYEISTPGQFEFQFEYSATSNHKFNFNFNASQIIKIEFSREKGIKIITQNGCEYGDYKLKPLVEEDEYYTQPQLTTSDKFELRVSKDNNEIFAHLNVADEVVSTSGVKSVRNIFTISGSKFFKISGGENSDLFRFHGDLPTFGVVSAGEGLNSLLLDESFVPNDIITVDLSQNLLSYSKSNLSIEISGIKSFHGRVNLEDRIILECDTQYIDGGGGEDLITILPLNGCNYTIKLEIGDKTTVSNGALRGEFIYNINGPRNFTVNFQNYTEELEHVFNLATNLREIKSIYFNQDTLELNIINFSPGNVFTHKVKQLEDDELFYTQPRIVLKEGAEIKISRTGEIYCAFETYEEIQKILEEFPEIAVRLNVTFYIITTSKIDNESVTIGNSGLINVLSNDETIKSHLFANGDENIFMIYPSNSDVIIYLNQMRENSQNTLDLTQLIKPIRAKTESKFVPKFQLYESDLIIPFEGMRIILKNGTNWYKNLKIVLNSAMMELHFENFPAKKEPAPEYEYWSIKPVPVNFQGKSIIYLNTDDLEENTEIIWDDENSENIVFGQKNGQLFATNSLNFLDEGEKHDLRTLVISGYSSEVLQKLEFSFQNELIDFDRMIFERPLENFTKIVEDFDEMAEIFLNPEIITGEIGVEVKNQYFWEKFLVYEYAVVGAILLFFLIFIVVVKRVQKKNFNSRSSYQPNHMKILGENSKQTVTLLQSNQLMEIET